VATKKLTDSVDVQVQSKAQALVLCDCGFGNAGDVVTLSSADAQVGVANGMLDLTASAIKAAQA
tara:strand:- start:245 stop:436 length:192 start_codon:yes stop_codon:yes gene_type:complete